jgi:adenine-specific DNA-methyltransferase
MGKTDSMTPNRSRPKKLASYYTPIEVAQILTDWAVSEADARVLDPSFGGCAFLLSALEALKRLGSPTAARQIYGVDIDPNAKPYLEELIAAGAGPDQLVIRDFFDVDADSFGDRLFGAIVGNPPYIRHHDIPNDAQRRAVARLKEFDIDISRRASYWAYFLLYSMQFLHRGGRLAMILPGAFLHTDYSQQVRHLLREYFAEVTLILLQERIFDDTEEESVILCASGARQPHKVSRVGSVSTVADLVRTFQNPEGSTRSLKDSLARDGLLRGLLASNALEAYDELLAAPSVIRLGDWIETRIGVVTGRNAYFILSSDERKKKEIPIEFFIPIIRRSSYLRGLWLEDSELKPITQNGHKYLLLKTDLNKTLLPESLQRYLEHGEEIGVPQAHKCQVRYPWYAVPRTFAPPAFMQCMSASWPRLVVNRSAYTCTNNILRLDWREKKRRTEDWTRLALGTLSTLSQLSAELVGRSYGGGILKIEPGELKELAVPLLPLQRIDDIADNVDILLRQGRKEDATEAVDTALLQSCLSLNESRLEQLRTARDLLFSRRSNARK